MTLRVASLPETHENSNFVILKVPIEIHRLQRGRQLICLDRERSREELGITSRNIECLRQAGLAFP